MNTMDTITVNVNYVNDINNITDIISNYDETFFAECSDEQILELEDHYYLKLRHFQKLKEENDNNHNFLSHLVRIYTEYFSMASVEKRSRNIYQMSFDEVEPFEYDDSETIILR